MSATTLTSEFAATLEFVPHPDIPGATRIRLKPGVQLPDQAQKLTEEEWDKFEKDIEESFEKLP